MQIVIELDDSDEEDGGGGGGGEDKGGGGGSSGGGGGPVVIDIDALDDTQLAKKLNKLTANNNGGSQGDDAGGEDGAIDLEALQAHREARRARMRKRNAAAIAAAAGNAVDVEDDASQDLLHDQRSRIRDFLAVRAPHFKIQELWHNPASKPGERLYEQFFNAWGAAPLKRLRMVFHGTAEANIDAICQNGLDPSRRAGQAYGPGEYFGGDCRRLCWLLQGRA